MLAARGVTDRPKAQNVLQATNRHTAHPVRLGACRSTGDDEVEASADAVLDERVGQAGGDGVAGVPAGAVGGDDHLRGQFGQRLDGRSDHGGEQGPVEMEATDDRVHTFNAREPLGVADDVDDAGMAAAGQNHEPGAAEVHD